mmetsp:Transcript_6839/g.17627  ORF Transcript_6839/g.17627 Transcript_6839/m.17627 type:complete len:464 (-) Transcript_6839:566-1957(-)
MSHETWQVTSPGHSSTVCLTMCSGSIDWGTFLFTGDMTSIDPANTVVSEDSYPTGISAVVSAPGSPESISGLSSASRSATSDDHSLNILPRSSSRLLSVLRMASSSAICFSLMTAENWSRMDEMSVSPNVDESICASVASTRAISPMRTAEIRAIGSSLSGSGCEIWIDSDFANPWRIWATEPAVTPLNCDTPTGACWPSSFSSRIWTHIFSWRQWGCQRSENLLWIARRSSLCVTVMPSIEAALRDSAGDVVDRLKFSRLSADVREAGWSSVTLMLCPQSCTAIVLDRMYAMSSSVTSVSSSLSHDWSNSLVTPDLPRAPASAPATGKSGDASFSGTRTSSCPKKVKRALTCVDSVYGMPRASTITTRNRSTSPISIGESISPSSAETWFLGSMASLIFTSPVTAPSGLTTAGERSSVMPCRSPARKTWATPMSSIPAGAKWAGTEALVTEPSFMPSYTSRR